MLWHIWFFFFLPMFIAQERNSSSSINGIDRQEVLEVNVIVMVMVVVAVKVVIVEAKRYQ